MIPEPSQEEMATVRTEAGQASGLIVMATARTEAGHASGLIVLAWSVMYRLIRAPGRLRPGGPWVIAALFAHVALTTPGFAMQARGESADAPAQGTAGHSPPARAARGPVTKGATTGLPLPRYATLRADKVNLRRGPGTRYPIDWVFRRRHLPVRVIREYGPWRQIRTVDHVEGWVLGSLLSARRGFIVTRNHTRLSRRPDPAARTVAILEAGVIGRLDQCGGGDAWCVVAVDRFSGFLQRTDIWGTEPGERVD